VLGTSANVRQSGLLFFFFFFFGVAYASANARSSRSYLVLVCGIYEVLVLTKAIQKGSSPNALAELVRYGANNTRI
jgi:hypothetical protein